MNTMPAPAEAVDSRPVNLHDVQALQEVSVREGLRLRPVEQSDAPRLLSILQADPQIRDRVSVAARLHTPSDLTAEIAAIEQDPGLLRYAILDNERCIGLVSFWRDDGFFGQEASPNAYGFGYFLDPAERGRGVVTSTLSRLMEVAQSELPVEQFMAFCEDDNQPSVRVLEELGFVATDETFVEPTQKWAERKYVNSVA